MTIASQALRALTKDLWYTVTVVVLLSAGMAAACSMFSILEACFLRDLAVREAGQLVSIRTIVSGEVEKQIDSAFASYIVAHSKTLAGVVMTGRATLQVDHSGRLEQASVEEVSPNYHAMLGVNPQLGRLLQPGSDSGPPEAVLSGRYWARRFRSDPGIVNTAVIVDGKQYVIVGVADQRFVGLDPGIPVDLTIVDREKRNHLVRAMGRLAGTATIRAAAAELQVLFHRWLVAEGYGEARVKELGVVIAPASAGLAETLGGNKLEVEILLLAAISILLIAVGDCAFLAGARFTKRRDEFAIRRALGASRRHLSALVLLENGALALVSSIIALFLTGILHQQLLALLIGQRIAEVLPFEVTSLLMAFGVTACVVSACLMATVGGLPLLWDSGRLARTTEADGKYGDSLISA